MKQRATRLIYTTVIALAIAPGIRAGEISHYNGGFLNIRDFFVPPEPGFYGAVYNYYYTTDRMNGKNGDQINSVTLNPPGGGAGTTLNLDVSVDIYVLSPSMIWVPDWEPIGARYGILVAPIFATASFDV